MDARPYVLREVKPWTFIYEVDGALPAEACREMVRLFEASEDQQYDGRLGQGQIEEQSVKRSTDLRISGNDRWRHFDRLLFESLSRALQQLSAEFPFFAVNRFRDLGYQLQRTRPGEYYTWHGISTAGPESSASDSWL